MNDDNTYEKLSNNFVDNCITIQERVLKHDSLMQVIMKADSPFDTINKIHTAVYKAGSFENIKWALETIDDLIEQKVLKSEDISGRVLKGHENDKGLVAKVLTKKTLLEEAFQLAARDFTWTPELTHKLHTIFSSAPLFRAATTVDKIGETAGWPKSALRFMDICEQFAFGVQFDRGVEDGKLDSQHT